MALEGSLRDFGLADILQLIYFQKKTGVLTLNGRDRVQLTFFEGNVVATESRKRLEENRLGKILLKKGVITEEDLKACLAEQKKTGMRIGDIFLKKGLTGQDDIRETLISQMTETVVQLFSWKEGTYEFQSQQAAPNKDIPIILDTQHILMDGLRIVDEWSLMEGKVTLDTVFRQTGEAGSDLTREENDLLSFVDGESDVSIIIDLCGIDDYQAARMLLSLMEKGIIEPVKIQPVVSEETVAPAVAGEKSAARFLPPIVFAVTLVISLIVVALQGAGSQGWQVVLWSGDSLNRIKAVRAIEELRFEAEVYKYQNGSYPQGLDQIGGRKDPWGRSYLYSIENSTLKIFSAGLDGKAGTTDDVY